MNFRIIGFGLSAVLAWGTCVSTAFAEQMNPEQIKKIINDTAASICTTVKDVRGQKSNVQIQGDVKAQLNGLIGKVIDIGGSGKGSMTQDQFEGLSQEATAAALEGDRGCRERVFNKMFDKLSEPIKILQGGPVTLKPGTIFTMQRTACLRFSLM